MFGNDAEPSTVIKFYKAGHRREAPSPPSPPQQKIEVHVSVADLVTHPAKELNRLEGADREALELLRATLARRLTDFELDFDCVRIGVRGEVERIAARNGRVTQNSGSRNSGSSGKKSGKSSGSQRTSSQSGLGRDLDRLASRVLETKSGSELQRLFTV